MDKLAPNVIEPLTPARDTGRFDCGNEALNLWLKRFAWTNVKNDSARVFVQHRRNSVVTGYYALTAGSIARDEAPQRIAQGLAAHPVGVAVLGRLAVDTSQQGKGIGILLLQDALRRVERAGDMIAIRAVMVQAIDETAKSFYGRFGFVSTRDDDKKMLLLMKDIRAMFRVQ